MGRLNALTLADDTGKHLERAVPRVRESGIWIGAVIEQRRRNGERVRLAARQARVRQVEERFAHERPSFDSRRIGIALQATPDFRDIPRRDGDVEIVGAEIRPAREDARGGGLISLPGDRAENHFDALREQAACERRVFEGAAQCHPT
jgi:hypothetical protein